MRTVDTIGAGKFRYEGSIPFSSFKLFNDLADSESV